jgi:hypothetical protein
LKKKRREIMKAFDEIDIKALKEICRTANATGLFKPKIKYIGIEDIAIFNNFITSVENLDETDQKELPQVVVDFYNAIFADEFAGETETVSDEDEVSVEVEDEYNGLTPLNFEELIPEDEEEILEEEPVEEEVPISKSFSEIAAEAPTPSLNEVLSVLIEQPIEVAPLSKMKRLAKIHMNTKVVGENLIITFKEIDSNMIFPLPPNGDREALKAFRKKVMAFATEKGASIGQKQAISKELNMAGFYMR